MAVMDEGAPMGITPGARTSAAGLSLIGAIAGAAIVLFLVVAKDLVTPLGLDRETDPVTLSLLAAAAVFMALGGIVAVPRLGLGGAIALIGALFWIAGCISFKSFGWLLAIPLAFAFLGALTGLIVNDRNDADPKLIYRQDVTTRITHWIWAVAMFFLLLSGLQIFNARPNLYIGQQSGFGFENSILDIYALNREGGPVGETKLFGMTFNTTGVLGVSGSAERPSFTAFPGWATIPSSRDLGTGRVVHFFFAWILVGTLGIWLVNAISTGHLWRDIILKPRDLRELPKDIVDHIRLRFTHGRSYTPLQKVAYFGVFVVAFPLIILTGLTMSPGMDAAWPWLLELFGGRQTARTIHFFAMLAFVLFFIVHILMVVLAGPFNELRSMITGYYKTNVHLEPGSKGEDH
ncbi:MAG: cytochrome b/b6 domain-containing protein [Devosia sp.]